jgi:homoprotocatechuate degradation regulator HpaR
MKPLKPPLGAKRTLALRHFSVSLPMLLLRAREAVMLHFRPMLREQGLTEQQWRVLRALDIERPLEASELAASTFLLGPSLSRILPDLERQGLIATTPHQTDQRRKLVWLTPTGASRMDLIAPLSERIYAEITAKVGAERLEDLQSSLVGLETGLRGAVSIEPGGNTEQAGKRGKTAGQRGRNT